MANVTRYKTSRGETRYRVRYRKPDGTQTDKRGFKRKSDAENWAAEHVTLAKATGSYVDPQAGKATWNRSGRHGSPRNVSDARRVTSSRWSASGDAEWSPCGGVANWHPSRAARCRNG